MSLTIERAEQLRRPNRTAFQGKGASTPWGVADSATWFADGITLYSTPSHGGFWLSPSRLLEMPAELRVNHYAGAQWFEEDCEAALVVVAVPEHFTADERERSLGYVGQWYPKALAAYRLTEHFRVNDATDETEGA
jgi:hypothetical protein